MATSCHEPGRADGNLRQYSPPARSKLARGVDSGIHVTRRAASLFHDFLEEKLCNKQFGSSTRRESTLASELSSLLLQRADSLGEVFGIHGGAHFDFGVCDH